MHINILATNKRKPTWIPNNSTVYINADWDYIGEQKWSWLSINDNGAFRCFRGHQSILKSHTTELILEDDAKPLADSWLDVVEKSLSLLSEYEVVSLHSRYSFGHIDKTLEHNGIKFHTLKSVQINRQRFGSKFFFGKWAPGSLAYLISPNAAKTIVNSVYDGTPFDLLLANKFKYCTIAVSPFAHVENKSLVESSQ